MHAAVYWHKGETNYFITYYDQLDSKHYENIR